MKDMKAIKKRIFDIIQIGNKDDIPSRIFDHILVAVICVNVVCMFLETFDELIQFDTVFRILEIITIIFFCIEYALRIWTAEYLYPQMSVVRARFRFLRSYDGVIDLLTILPFFFLSGFVAFRMLRVVRIFHLFRLNAQYDSFNVITSVLYEKRNQILSSVFIILVLMMASSLCMYSAEHEAQPSQFANAFSGIWWAMSTLLTVGYGDIYPITIMGKCMAIVIAFLGVGVVAIPTGIISAGFVEVYQKDLGSEEKMVDIAHIGEIYVDANSNYLGYTIAELTEKYQIQVHLLIRGKLNVIATEDLTILEGDILVVQSDKIQKNTKCFQKETGGVY
jgi:voltage-gated potassium channel